MAQDYYLDMTVPWSQLPGDLTDNFTTIMTQWAGTTSPSDPENGQPWLDTSNGFDNAVLKFYNGSEWVLANKYNPYIQDLIKAMMDKDSLYQFLAVAHNPDGTLKSDQAENMTEWIDANLGETYVSATEFQVDGDQTDIFVANRRIKAALDGSTVYSDVSSASYDSVNDVTTVTISDNVLDSTLQSIEYGLVKPGSEGSFPSSEIEKVINNDSDHGSTAQHDYYTNSEAVNAVNGETSLSVNISGDADSVDGYDIQKNGTDGSGIINFKT